MSRRIVVATIDARHCRDLRRLVDLLCAIQVCWPSAQAEFSDNTITVDIADADRGLAA